MKNPRPTSGAGYGHHHPSPSSSSVRGSGLYIHDGQYAVLIDALSEDGSEPTPEVIGILPTEHEAVGTAHDWVTRPRGLPDWYAWVEQDGRFVYGIYTWDGAPTVIETRNLEDFKRGLEDTGYHASLNETTPNPRPVLGAKPGHHHPQDECEQCSRPAHGRWKVQTDTGEFVELRLCDRCASASDALPLEGQAAPWHDIPARRNPRPPPGVTPGHHASTPSERAASYRRDLLEVIDMQDAGPVDNQIWAVQRLAPLSGRTFETFDTWDHATEARVRDALADVRQHVLNATDGQILGYEKEWEHLMHENPRPAPGTRFGRHTRWTPASVWEEIGLENETLEGKAASYRDHLLDIIDNQGRDDKLPAHYTPILPDLTPRSRATFADWKDADERDADAAFEELREQVLNATPAQIVGYADAWWSSTQPNPRAPSGATFGHREAVLRPLVVGFDEGGIHHASAWNAYTDGKTWNGFIVPWVDAETRDDIIDFLEYVDEEDESDASETVEAIRALEPHLKDTPDGKKQLYQIDEGLTFNEVEEPVACTHCAALHERSGRHDIQCLDCGKMFYPRDTTPNLSRRSPRHRRKTTRRKTTRRRAG